jgi:hypothetical protein
MVVVKSRGIGIHGSKGMPTEKLAIIDHGKNS